MKLERMKNNESLRLIIKISFVEDINNETIDAVKKRLSDSFGALYFSPQKHNIGMKGCHFFADAILLHEDLQIEAGK